MKLFRRLTVMFLAIGMGAAPGLAAQPALASPPGYLAPGEYVNKSTFATFQSFDGYWNADVDVTQDHYETRLRNGATVKGDQTVLSVYVANYSDQIFFQGCYLIPSTDFITSSDLSSMTVITTIMDSTPDCGFPNSIPSGTVISLQWLGTGPVASSSNVINATCTGYRQESRSSSSNNLATVSGTISGVLPNPLSNVPGFIEAGAGDIHVSGTAADSCPPGGNGRGAGVGPQPAGNYDFTNNQEFAVYQSPDFSQFLEIIATRNVNVTNPKGGPASGARTSNGPVTSVDAQVEIRITDFNTDTFFSGCYEIAPGALNTNGITSASLSVYLDGSQPACPNDPFDQQNVPMPLTVDASWVGTGPSAPVRDVGQFSCASYNTQSTAEVNAVAASSSFTLPEIYPGQTFAWDQSALSTSDLKMHASGTDPPSCIVRG